LLRRRGHRRREERWPRMHSLPSRRIRQIKPRREIFCRHWRISPERTAILATSLALLRFQSRPTRSARGVLRGPIPVKFDRGRGARPRALQLCELAVEVRQAAGYLFDKLVGCPYDGHRLLDLVRDDRVHFMRRRPGNQRRGGARPSGRTACWRNRTDAIPERDPAILALHRPHLG
jgi:hypothetical protein